MTAFAELPAPTITAKITARGPRSTVPDDAGAVDATLYVDGLDVGDCTLLPRQYDGRLDVWGAIDHWASGGGAFGDLVAAALGARAGRGAGGFDRRLAALTTTQVLGSLLRVTIAGRLMRGAA